MSFTKKRLLRKKFRSKRIFSKKRFLSFSRTDNVQSNITTMRASKFDEDGPGFFLGECSKPFVQVYLFSLLLKKVQKYYAEVVAARMILKMYFTISLPFLLQRQKELFSQSGFRKFSLQYCDWSEKLELINLLEKLEWEIQFRRYVEVKQTKTRNFERHVWVWNSFLQSSRIITKTFFLFA